MGHQFNDKPLHTASVSDSNKKKRLGIEKHTAFVYFNFNKVALRCITLQKIQ